MKSLRSFGLLKRPRTPFIIRQVHGDSMLPTLKPGQLIVGRYKTLKNGDVVIVRHQGLEKIKRVTAISGDSLFIEGDNPRASRDSRQFGPVLKENVVAVVTFPRVGRRPPASTS